MVKMDEMTVEQLQAECAELREVIKRYLKVEDHELTPDSVDEILAFGYQGPRVDKYWRERVVPALIARSDRFRDEDRRRKQQEGP